MSLKATVTTRGAILLGTYVACDAFDEARPLRVVTHAHYDHTLGLRQSLKKCETVVMTPATKDLIEVLKGSTFLTAGKVKTLEYKKALTYEDERLTLHYADHILGAAQVLLEDADGTRILYTSDFRLPKTPVIEADILVMEATYGNPSRVRPFENMVEDMLVSLVEQGLRQGPVYVFGYHGKLQEVMQILNDAKVEVPFIVPERVFHVSKVCEKHGMRLGGCLLSSDEDAQVMLRKSVPCVALYHMGSRQYVGKDAFRIRVSGWEFRRPCRKIAENEYVIALSDHSDFNGLLQYVKESKPAFVITDNHRVGDAVALAREVQRRLNIPARPLPP
jgi:putative mRNA 3-end processing factor